MCGIAGWTDDPNGRAVQAMCATLRHRGPDEEGIRADPATGVAIGVRRLAILDIAGGHQPLSNEDGTVWVVFNGEIYNHAELRRHLQQRGHSFATRTDTEVLVHLYEEYGDELVHALDGMFAFAISDERQGRLLLARDRFGQKPLFLHEHGRELLFASELTPLLVAKPALRELDPAALDAFFVFGYLPGPRSIVPAVRQLPPGHLLSWRRGEGVQEIRRWWSPPTGEARLHESRESLAAETRELFERSVAARLIADVPVGVFLSGGIDSTLLTAVAVKCSTAPVRTFTIGYDVGSFDETAEARRVAAELGTEHHEITLTGENVAVRVPRLLAEIDQPLGDQALVPLHALSEFARPLVTVALGGEGADELFGGYPRYRWMERSGRVEAALPEPVSRALGRLPQRAGRVGLSSRVISRVVPAGALERHLDWVTGGRRWHRPALYGPRLARTDGELLLTELVRRAGGRFDDDSIGRRLMRLDQIDYLPDDVLVKSDRAGMLASLEIRTAYLNRELAEFAGTVDPSVHLSGLGKNLLHSMLPPRMSAPRGSMRYRKTAFRAPTAEWLRGPLQPLLRTQLQSGTIYGEGYFDRAAATALADRHAAGRHDHSDVLWPLLALGVWADRFFGADGC
jgi:asparagine synthase (glutamine-hydrolysing)